MVEVTAALKWKTKASILVQTFRVATDREAKDNLQEKLVEIVLGL